VACVDKIACVIARPPPRWPTLTTFVPAGARADAPQLQKRPQPSSWTRRHASTEHSQHRGRLPGPGTAQSTPSAHAREPQHGPKLAPASTLHGRASCSLNGPPRHRRAVRWRLGRPGPRQTASPEGRGHRAGSARTHVQPEARASATPPTASPGAQRARTPAAQRPRRTACRLRAAA